MESKDWLLLGLSACGRAASLNYFDDGHRAGAILAGHYLCKDNQAEAGARDYVLNKITGTWAKTDLCRNFSSEASDSGLTESILQALALQIAEFREVGHHVILGALALKAFRDLPEALTPARAQGLCRLLTSFKMDWSGTRALKEFPGPLPTDIPSVVDLRRFSEFTLVEFLKAVELSKGRGQGGSAHLCSHAYSLVTLVSLGFPELAAKGLPVFAEFIRLLRLPRRGGFDYPEHEPTPWTPLQAAYWPSRSLDWELGHGLDYPYGFYGLLAQAGDAGLKKACLAEAFRVL